MHEIESIIGKGSQDDRVFNVINTIMVARNMAYSEVLKIPLPFAFLLLKQIHKEQEEMKKQSKKR